MKFQLEPYNRGLPDDAFLDDLRRVAADLGKPVLTRDEYEKYGRFHPGTLAKRFGTWLTAVARAGLAKSRNLKVPANECLDDLKRVARLLGKSSVSVKEYAAHGTFSNRHFIRHFGSWNAALSHASLAQSPMYFERSTDEEYFENLESVWRGLGRQPKTTDMLSPLSKFSAHAYKRRFGSWRKALEAFVRFVNDTPNVATDSDSKTNPQPANVALQQTKPRRTSRTVSWRMRFIVMRRDNFKCRLCGASPALNPGIVLVVDHIDPWSAGGETELDNLQTLCEPCNGGKSDLPLHAQVAG